LEQDKDMFTRDAIAKDTMENPKGQSERNSGEIRTKYAQMEQPNC
jgi:hypothetical protein